MDWELRNSRKQKEEKNVSQLKPSSKQYWLVECDKILMTKVKAAPVLLSSCNKHTSMHNSFIFSLFLSVGKFVLHLFNNNLVGGVTPPEILKLVGELSDGGRRQHTKSGGLKFILFLKINIYHNLKRWGITLSGNECV